jgi:cell division septum initiation protein DivIVA
MREDMEYIKGVLDELDAIVHNASPVPMRKGRALVDRSDLLVMLDELRGSLPKELSDAETVRRESSAMVAAAEEEAGRILENARERAESQVEHTDIYLRAERRSAEIIEEAERYADEVSSGSEAYRDRIMGQLAGWCEDSLASVRDSRRELNEAPVRRPSRHEPAEDEQDRGWRANSA